MVKRLYCELVGTVHYNVKFKSGGLLNANPEEIRELCKRAPKR